MTFAHALPRREVPPLVLAIFLFLLTWTVLLAGNAAAQLDFPRLGLSAARDDYVAEMGVGVDDTFTIYVGAYGTESGMVLEEQMISMPWVVHQACCGGQLEIVEFEYNPDLITVGHPLSGVSSVAPDCITADYIPLAVLRVLLHPPVGVNPPEEYLLGAGPFNASENCAGENPPFLEGVLRVSVGVPAPVVKMTWVGVKAIYR